MRYILLTIFSFIVLACQQPADEHGHDHAATGHDESTISIDTTIWTADHELFVEYPALVAGKTSRFAAHFTQLKGHEPVTEGSLAVSLIKGGKGIRHQVERPASPGIFAPALQPKAAGDYQLIFDLQTGENRERIILENVKVYASVEEAEQALPETETGGQISFLKEQAWKIDFQTVPVVEGEIYNIINTSGRWEAAPGASKTIIANANGMIDFQGNILTEGANVQKGQLLMTISSAQLSTNNLTAEIAKARANLEQARSAYERKKQLYEKDIVPRSEFELAENSYEVAKSNYETLTAGYSAGGKQIRAPFSGFVKAIHVSNGDYVNQGAQLISLGSHQSHLLQTDVSISLAAELEHIQNIWYRTENGHWSGLNEAGGALLSVGKEVNLSQPLLTVYARVNEQITAPEGSFTEVQIATGEQRQALLVPYTSLLEDYGAYEIIVQLSGETFERRPVKIGRSNGALVEIIKGLQAGEYVVTEGAYQVKMSSMSGQVPAHGHSH